MEDTQNRLPNLGSERPRPEDATGPDPIYGAGIALVGIFIMGVSGAAEAHYPFDLGVLIAVIGAVTFVSCVIASAVRQSTLREDS